MTRINLIQPRHLTKVHLVAEYKELTQFLHLVKRRVEKGDDFSDLPVQYCLNGGHCKFFYNKGKYLHDRYIKLKAEMLKRKIRVDLEKFNYNLNRIKTSYSAKIYKDYVPDKAAYQVAVDRIGDRILLKPERYPDMNLFFDNVKNYGVIYEASSDLSRDTSFSSGG